MIDMPILSTLRRKVEITHPTLEANTVSPNTPSSTANPPLTPETRLNSPSADSGVMHAEGLGGKRALAQPSTLRHSHPTNAQQGIGRRRHIQTPHELKKKLNQRDKSKAQGARRTNHRHRASLKDSLLLGLGTISLTDAANRCRLCHHTMTRSISEPNFSGLTMVRLQSVVTEALPPRFRVATRAIVAFASFVVTIYVTWLLAPRNTAVASSHGSIDETDGHVVIALRRSRSTPPPTSLVLAYSRSAILKATALVELTGRNRLRPYCYINTAISGHTLSVGFRTDVYLLRPHDTRLTRNLRAHDLRATMRVLTASDLSASTFTSNGPTFNTPVNTLLTTAAMFSLSHRQCNITNATCRLIAQCTAAHNSGSTPHITLGSETTQQWGILNEFWGLREELIRTGRDSPYMLTLAVRLLGVHSRGLRIFGPQAHNLCNCPQHTTILRINAELSELAHAYYAPNAEHALVWFSSLWLAPPCFHSTGPRDISNITFANGTDNGTDGHIVLRGRVYYTNARWNGRCTPHGYAVREKIEPNIIHFGSFPRIHPKPAQQCRATITHNHPPPSPPTHKAPTPHHYVWRRVTRAPPSSGFFTQPTYPSHKPGFSWRRVSVNGCTNREPCPIMHALSTGTLRLQGGAGGQAGNSARKRANKQAVSTAHTKNPKAQGKHHGNSTPPAGSPLLATPIPPPASTATAQPPQPNAPPKKILLPLLGFPYTYYNDDEMSKGADIVVIPTCEPSIPYHNTGDFGTSSFCTVVGTGKGGTWNGGSPTTLVRNAYGRVLIAVMEGTTLCQISSLRLGTYQYSLDPQKQKKVVAAGPYQTLTVPAVRKSGIHSSVATYTVFLPLYHSFKKFVRTAYTPMVERSVIGYAHRTLCELMVTDVVTPDIQDVFDATVRAFLHVTDGQQAGLRLNRRMMPTTHPDVIDEPTETFELWHIKGHGMVEKRPHRIQPVCVMLPYRPATDVEFEIPPHLQLDNDGNTRSGPAKVIHHTGILSQDMEMFYGSQGYNAIRRARDHGIHDVPVFTQSGVSKRDMTKLAYFRLTGNGTDRLPSEESTDSLLGAMKRLAGIRDNECTLYNNERLMQVAACNAVVDTYHKTALILKFPNGLNTRKQPNMRGVPAFAGLAVYGDYIRSTVANHVLAMFNANCSQSALVRQLKRGASTIQAVGHSLRVGAEKSVEDRAIWFELVGPSATAELIRKVVANLPHEKIGQRRQFFSGIGVHDPDDVVTHLAFAKMKLEDNKVKKVGRLFVPYGAGWIAAPHVAVMFKAVMDGWAHYRLPMSNGDKMDLLVYRAYYPTQTELDRAAALMLSIENVRNCAVYLIHGDDQTSVTNVNGKVYWFNGDVAAMDASQKSFAHTLLGTAYRALDPDFGLTPIRQATAGIRITNPVDPSAWFVVHPNGKDNPTLGSGSTNTTPMNTVVSECLAVATTAAFIQRGISDDPAINENTVTTSCREVGYNVTVATCYRDGHFTPQLVEFLKHFIDPHNRIFVRMPTSYLKNFGTMFGSPTPIRLGLTHAEYRMMSHAELAHTYCSAVVRGLVHEPNHSIMQVLRERFTDGRTHTHHHSGDTGPHPDTVSSEPRDDIVTWALDQSIMIRYNISSDILENIVSCLGNITVGHVTPVLTEMLALDYGTGLPDADPEDWVSHNPGVNNGYVEM